ncbi:hypothetical protein B0T22DRAFT_441259 [Podospora appendiculata]|uniref:Uncharacterized protein n=1 Tax=Podospora appendiculata TaxID=314037 RepID=A0AAE0XCM6_9PEZI|nr:hypothetical protein B0T22DRAFT_441259 [Podospora appendiculata]
MTPSKQPKHHPQEEHAGHDAGIEYKRATFGKYGRHLGVIRQLWDAIDGQKDKRKARWTSKHSKRLTSLLEASSQLPREDWTFRVGSMQDCMPAAAPAYLMFDQVPNSGYTLPVDVDIVVVSNGAGQSRLAPVAKNGVPVLASRFFALPLVPTVLLNSFSTGADRATQILQLVVDDVGRFHHDVSTNSTPTSIHNQRPQPHQTPIIDHKSKILDHRKILVMDWSSADHDTAEVV